jgi:hypothetical protein
VNGESFPGLIGAKQAIDKQLNAAAVVKNTQSIGKLAVTIAGEKYNLEEVKQMDVDLDKAIVYTLQREVKELMIGVRLRVLELDLRGHPIEKSVAHEIETLSERGV